MEVSGAKALVTGASRGVGLAIAKALLEKGAMVWGTSRVPEEVNWPEGVTPLRMDLSSSEAIETAWLDQGLGEIEFDIVVNNAGSGAFARYEELPFETWEAQIDLLLLGAMKIARLALPGLKERKGYLVNVGSLAAEFPIPFMSAYNAAKAGLSAFTESLVIESVGSGLKVVNLELGDLKTDFNRSVVVKIGKNEIGVCADTVWKRIERRISSSPTPDIAANQLLRCIEKEKIGRIRAGSRFQTIFAPLFSRLAPRNLIRTINISYYGK